MSLILARLWISAYIRTDSVHVSQMSNKKIRKASAGSGQRRGYRGCEGDRRGSAEEADLAVDEDLKKLPDRRNEQIKIIR